MDDSFPWWVSVVAVSLCWVWVPAESRAAITISESEDGGRRFELSGYVRSTSGVHALGYGDPYLQQTRGLNAASGRLQWLAILGPKVELDMHQELFWNATTAASSSGGGGTLIGVGATRGPEPTVDLEPTLIDERGLRLTHDVDRFAIDVYTEAADLTIGRQAITWGKSALFPVADLWTRLSPFELDTFQKPGIDAIRALVYPSMTSELDLVVADRGSLEDLSAGVRGGATVGDADVWAAGGKFWEEILAMVGTEYVWERVKFRAEAVLPWSIDGRELDVPRATGGFEWYGGELTIGAEYHFNGIGAESADGYADQLASEEFGRGESYFLGRHYAGAFGSFTGISDLEFSLSTIGNLTDPSLIATPIVRYQVAQNTRLGVGSFLSVGEEPELRPLPALRSEFGTYGNFYFVELTAHY